MYTLRSRLAVMFGLFALAGAATAAVAGGWGLAATGASVALAPILAYAVGRGVARSLMRPIDRLGATAASFAAGNRSARATTDGPRETRMVAEAFNRMADDVSDALEQLNSEEVRKSQFVSDVSHELRTPLTAIRGAAETLLDGGVNSEDQERFLSTIATEAERLTRLANDLLQLQRIEGATGELPFRQVDLREAAVRAAAMLEPLIEDRGVSIAIEGRAPLVLGDLDRLQQVVANLVDNATRAVGNGGHVRVELFADGAEAVLCVSDDGPGIPAADLDRLFDRFYKADTSRARSGGAGLGLAIVRAIVLSHGGSISAENLPDHGARLTVRLPALPSD